MTMKVAAPSSQFSARSARATESRACSTMTEREYFLPDFDEVGDLLGKKTRKKT